MAEEQVLLRNRGLQTAQEVGEGGPGCPVFANTSCLSSTSLAVAVRRKEDTLPDLVGKALQDMALCIKSTEPHGVSGT